MRHSRRPRCHAAACAGLLRACSRPATFYVTPRSHQPSVHAAEHCCAAALLTDERLAPLRIPQLDSEGALHSGTHLCATCTCEHAPCTHVPEARNSACPTNCGTAGQSVNHQSCAVGAGESLGEPKTEIFASKSLKLSYATDSRGCLSACSRVRPRERRAPAAPMTQRRSGRRGTQAPHDHLLIALEAAERLPGWALRVSTCQHTLSKVPF